MKVQDTNTLAGKFGETAGFDIASENIWFAIRVLIDQYKRPLEAAVREALQNAWDSHIAAGNEAAIFVQAPTALDRSLVIRDYGTGLSYEQMMTLYASVGASTKRNSDDFVGGFGIGRLSALAYAEQFVVTSFYNGTQHTFLISHRGVHYVGAEETNEINGLKVEFDVQKSDLVAANRLLRTYALLSSIPLDIANVEVPDAPVWYGENFYVVGLNNDILGVNTAHVCMGGVLYPIDFTTFWNVGAEMRELVHWPGLVVEMPIGSLRPTPSRESLILSKESDAVLEAAMTGIRDAFTELFFEGCDTVAQKAARLETYPDGTAIYSHLRQTFMKQLNRAYDAVTYSQRRGGELSRSVLNGRWNWLNVENAVVLVDDIESGRKYVTQTVFHLLNTTGKGAVVRIDKTDYDKDDYLQERGDVYLWSTIDLPKEATVKGGRGGGYKPRAGYRFVGSRYTTNSRENWHAVQELPEEPIYVVIANFEVVSEVPSVPLYELGEMLSEDIYGVTKTNIPEDGVPLMEWLYKKLSKVDPTPIFQVDLAKAFYDRLNFRFTAALEKAGVALIHYPDSTTYDRALCDLYRRVIPTGVSVKAANEYADTIMAYYPMLQHLRTYGGNHTVIEQDVIDYIRLVDAANEFEN